MGSFPCADCGQTLNNAQARSHHRWSQHANIPPISAGGKQYAVEREEDGTVRCPVHQCGRSYKSREAFTKHAKIVHGSGSKPATPSSGPTVSSSQELSFGPSSNWKMPEPSADFREGLGPGVTDISCKTGFPEVASSHRPGQVEAVESERNVGKLIGRAFGWLGLLASLLGVATEKPARAREEVLDAKELTAQVSEVVADAVMKKLAEIGLTAENLKKLEILAEMVPIDTPAVVSPGVSLERTGGHHPGGGDDVDEIGEVDLSL
ncbi:hypothetical protein L210DRAFT_2166330 [Boletus edulis BED1]|uniref:C2H2-type domain-containing protein n=1 Tax=Boletus edulis BED1 TaxID=1328754 RepID=A0AAD4G6V4_BOLED|nr:hypothetical protein L210DRAFT_2166330 [Boletus edulis BED1]